MTRNKIIILTAYFPHGYAEPFILNEINFLSQFYDIEIFPLLKERGTKILRATPTNVTVHKPLLKRNYIFRFLQGIFNRSPISPYFKDILKLRSTSKNKQKSFIDWSLNLNSFRATHSNNILRKSLNSKKTILYFYWNSMPIKYFSDINNIMLIRVHGGEIELERNSGYITLLKDKVVAQSNRIYLPISEAADMRLKKLNSKVHTKISRLGVFDNGLNPENNKKDDITIVSCSHLIPLKRVHLIVEALSHIKENRVHWIHIGDGIMYDHLIKISKKLPTNITVSFKGTITNTEVVDFYKNNHIDLFINVSETEGVPVSIMEALSFGIPCFATAVGGTGEIVDDNVGKIVDKNFQPVILADFINEIKSLSISNNLRQNAKKRWFDRCNAMKNYADLKMFIDECIEVYIEGRC